MELFALASNILKSGFISNNQPNLSILMCILTVFKEFYKNVKITVADIIKIDTPTDGELFFFTHSLLLCNCQNSNGSMKTHFVFAVDPNILVKNHFDNRHFDDTAKAPSYG